MAKQRVTTHDVKSHNGRRSQTRIDGKLVLEDYYRAGGHVYEIPQGRGKPRARVCFEETPRGDGGMLWEENAGLVEWERVTALLSRL